MIAFENKYCSENAKILNRFLYERWGFGKNIVLGWSVDKDQFRAILVPHYFILDFITLHKDNHTAISSRYINSLLSGSKMVAPEQLSRVAEMLGVDVVGYCSPSNFDLTNDQIEEVVSQYSISFVKNRAVVLFDIVGFSLLDPIEQMTQLNSLSYSINSAYTKLSAVSIGSMSFSRTTTGDGFYVWNVDSTLESSLNLYRLMQLVLADNAVAKRKATSRSVPCMRAGFHIGDHYEFRQVENLSPTSTYIVGDVTIELSRILGGALPGQIVLGDFHTAFVERGIELPEKIDPQEFIRLAQPGLGVLRGIEVSGEKIESIRCYLTGLQKDDGEFSVSRYRIVDKHGKSRLVYNAKVNLYRSNHAKPIFLGIQDQDLPSNECPIGVSKN